nr:hypothetical protein [Candidatus Sigynarchaeota archaeon]
MSQPGNVGWQHDLASKVEGVEWAKKSMTKGTLKITSEVFVEFDFKDYPSFKIFPKEVRTRLPQVVDMLPALVLWDEDNHPTWAEVLQELKAKITAILGSNNAPGAPVLDRAMLEGLLDAARRGHPNESFFLLKRDGRGILADVVLPQGAKGGKVAAYFMPDRLPYDAAIEGSFHSHPSGNGAPSEQDLKVFIQYKINVIAYYPYNEKNYKVYNNRGKPIDVEVTGQTTV